MSYTTHNFTSGMKLTGQAMAEVDAQIALNEENIATESARIDLIPSQRQQDIRKISLDVDSDALYLYYDTELLSRIAFPEISDRVPCTSLSATGVLTGLIVGDTAQVTATKQPSDCNQAIRFFSMDTTVATVTSTGLVTAVGSGSTTIQVACGSYTQSLTVKVSRNVSFVGNVTPNCGWLTAGTFDNDNAVYFTTDGANDYLGNFPFDLTKFKIRDGETATLTILEQNWKLRPGFVITEEAGKTIEIDDYREDLDRYILRNAISVDEITNGSTSYTYTNNTGKDCWLVFTVHYVNSTAEEAVVNIDSKISLVIGPA